MSTWSWYPEGGWLGDEYGDVWGAISILVQLDGLQLLVELRRGIEAVAAACRTRIVRIEPTDEMIIIPPPRLVAGQAAKWARVKL